MSTGAPSVPDGVLAGMVASAPAGMSVHDADRCCLVINEVLAEINEVSVADSLGRIVAMAAWAVRPTQPPSKTAPRHPRSDRRDVAAVAESAMASVSERP